MLTKFLLLSSTTIIYYVLMNEWIKLKRIAQLLILIHSTCYKRTMVIVLGVAIIITKHVRFKYIHIYVLLIIIIIYNYHTSTKVCLDCVGLNIFALKY